MTDRELLELAAKAVQHTGDLNFRNFDVLEDGSAVCLELGVRRGAITSYWKPLTDDGDALRLAVKLGLGVRNDLYTDMVHVSCFEIDAAEVPYEQDMLAATRRAIVMAAAQIAKATGEAA